MKESALVKIASEYLGQGTVKSPRELAMAICRCGELLDLWPLGGLTFKELRTLSTKAARGSSYRTFAIPKRSGGVRVISAPTARLKDIQRAINLLLQIKAAPAEWAVGFVAGRSVADNALPHVGSRIVVNCDIEDFFPSVSKRMVREAFLRELSGYIESREAMNLLCNLVTWPSGDGQEVLPQGAPSSPMTGNVVLARLDRRMAAFAAGRGYAYTRYADDITLSDSGAEGRRTFTPRDMQIIERIVTEEGFRLNRKKISRRTRAERQEVTGLTVNERMNVSRTVIKQLRVLLHLWETRGYAEASAIYVRDFRSGADVDLLRVLRGKINYIGMVKGKRDAVYRRCLKRLKGLIENEK